MAITVKTIFTKATQRTLFKAVPRLTPIDGEAATIEVGTVTTLPAGSDATVDNSGTENAAVFDFGIPRGDPGVVQSIVEGSNITVDDTDPANPIISSVGGSAATVTFAPSGNIAATNVQAAIEELDAEKQPLDSDLTSWAGVTRAAGFDTFAGTPSSANLRSLLTDESGTGAALFAGTPGTSIANTPTGNIAATTVQAAIDELDAEKIGGSTGVTDNRLLRADGTGGKTAQNSPVAVDDAGAMTGLTGISMAATGASLGLFQSTANGFKQVAYKSLPAVGAAGDGIDWAFNFTNAAGTEKQLALLRMALGDATDGSEDTTWQFYGTVAGALALQMQVGAGVYHPSATGTDKGNNTLNFGQLWYNGVQLSPPGVPVTKTADFTVAASEQYLINNKSGSTCTVTLPAAASFPGRKLHFKNSQAQTVVSASSNVVPRVTAAAGTAILASGNGNWCKMVSDGTNWVIVAGS